MARRLWAGLLVGLAATLLVAACAEGEMTAEGEKVPLQDTMVTETQREIIRNADMQLRVDDVRDAVVRIGSITAQAGGRVSSQTIDAMGESVFATVTARVPAERLDGVITAVGDIGQVMSLSIQAEDVTAQGADLDARIAALQASIDRLGELLADAATTKDLIEIEAELTIRQAELDSLVAQRAALSDLVAMSTLTIMVTPSSEAGAWTPPGFLSGLQSGWNALRTVVGALITLAGFVLPFIGAIAIIAVPITLVIILLRRRK